MKLRKKQPHRKSEKIKSYELNTSDKANEYERITTKNMEETKENMNMEQLWQNFRDNVIVTAKQVCGITKEINENRHTAWGTDEVKKQVAEKIRVEVIFE